MENNNMNFAYSLHELSKAVKSRALAYWRALGIAFILLAVTVNIVWFFDDTQPLAVLLGVEQYMSYTIIRYVFIGLTLILSFIPSTICFSLCEVMFYKENAAFATLMSIRTKRIMMEHAMQESSMESVAMKYRNKVGRMNKELESGQEDGQ